MTTKQDLNTAVNGGTELIDLLDEAANAENTLLNSHPIKQLKFNLKPSIRGII